MKKNGGKEITLNKMLAAIGLTFVGAIIIHGFFSEKLLETIGILAISLICAVIVPHATDNHP